MIIAPFPISVRSGYFIPVCSRNKFSNSRQIHPVGASKSLIVSLFTLDISVIIRFLLRVKSIGVFGVSICLHSLVLVQGCLPDKKSMPFLVSVELVRRIYYPLSNPK